MDIKLVFFHVTIAYFLLIKKNNNKKTIYQSEKAENDNIAWNYV